MRKYAAVVVAFALGVLAWKARGGSTIPVEIDDDQEIIYYWVKSPGSYEVKALLQLEVAVLENGRKETEKALFCRNKIRYTLRNWDLDPKIERLTTDQAVSLFFHLRRFGRAKRCWNPPAKILEEVVGRGEHILATFDPLPVVNLDELIGEASAEHRQMAYQVH